MWFAFDPPFFFALAARALASATAAAAPRELFFLPAIFAANRRRLRGGR